MLITYITHLLFKTLLISFRSFGVNSEFLVPWFEESNHSRIPTSSRLWLTTSVRKHHTLSLTIEHYYGVNPAVFTNLEEIFFVCT